MSTAFPNEPKIIIFIWHLIHFLLDIHKNFLLSKDDVINIILF